MDLCKEIQAAKCCVVKMADAYVKAATYGDDTKEMLDELILFNGYIKTLERYQSGCLSKDDICSILNHISFVCESCECGC